MSEANEVDGLRNHPLRSLHSLSGCHPSQRLVEGRLWLTLHIWGVISCTVSLSIAAVPEVEDITGAGWGPEAVFEALLLQPVPDCYWELVVAAEMEWNKQFRLEGGCANADAAILCCPTVQKGIADLESYVYRCRLIS